MCDASKSSNSKLTRLLYKGRKLHTLPELEEAAFPVHMKGTIRFQQQISQTLQPWIPFVGGTDTYIVGEPGLESVHTAYAAEPHLTNGISPVVQLREPDHLTCFWLSFCPSGPGTEAPKL